MRRSASPAAAILAVSPRMPGTLPQIGHTSNGNAGRLHPSAMLRIALAPRSRPMSSTADLKHQPAKTAPNTGGSTGNLAGIRRSGRGWVSPKVRLFSQDRAIFAAAQLAVNAPPNGPKEAISATRQHPVSCDSNGVGWLNVESPRIPRRRETGGGGPAEWGGIRECFHERTGKQTKRAKATKPIER